MDYWGISRTHTSLRLNLLKRLLSVGQAEDVARFANAIPEVIAGRPSAPKEAEVLLAFTSGVKTQSAGFYAPMHANLAAIFYSSLEIWVDESELLAPSAIESCSLRYGKCLARQVSADLAYYFASQNSPEIFVRFFDLFDERWSSQESLPEPAFASLFGSLLGCLEGIAAARVPQSVYHAVFERVRALSSPNFIVPAQKHLSTLRESFELSIPALLKGIAEISELYTLVAGPNLPALVDFSQSQLDELDGTQQFHIDVASHHTHSIQAAIDAHFRVLEFAVTNDSESYYGLVFSHVSRALGDTDLTWEPLTSSLGRIAAKLAGHSYQRLVQIFVLFTDFLSHLEPSSAYKSARQFAEGCKDHFTDESSRIKLLYQLINKLNHEDYHIVESEMGTQGALEWVAAVLSATVAVVSVFDSSDYAGLAVTMLDQKLGTVTEDVDAQVVETWGLLVPYLAGTKFHEVLELLTHVERRGKPKLWAAVKTARVTISQKCTDPKYYLDHLLDLLVLNGDPSHQVLVRNLFAPLAALSTRSIPMDDPKTMSSFHNVWLNLAALGFTVDSLKGEDLVNAKTLAKWTPPLVDHESANFVESSLQLNPILCREISSDVMKIQHNALNRVIDRVHTGRTSSARTIFMAATLLLEELRTRSGSVSKLPHYFTDLDIGNGSGHAPMLQLTRYLTSAYIANLGYASEDGLTKIAQSLKELLVLACHRIEPVRYAASEMITRIVNDIPAAFCQHDALYALLDCLSLLGQSTKNAVEDEFSPKAVFTAPLSGVTLELSDNLDSRLKLIREFEGLAHKWVTKISTLLLPDLRSKLYTYLGHSGTVGRGCRFALDILATSGADDDYFSQYLILSHYDSQKISFTLEETLLKLRSAATVADLQTAYIAAAPHINKSPHAVILAIESVKAPFRIFSDEAITAGIRFWHHTIRHQAQIRSVVVNEVIEQSILTAQQKRGLFSREHDDIQPLWAEMVYEPTNKKKMVRHETLVHQKIAPHYRLLSGFLRSAMHNSVLLNQTYMIMFNRLTVSWLQALIHHGSLHSIARNLRLEVIEYSFELLKFLWSSQKPSHLNRRLGLQLEKLIVEAGLAWFRQPAPQWPYGSNTRSQAKTLLLLKQLVSSLQTYVSSGTSVSLLISLVSQEYNKLLAWYDPLGSISILPAEPVSPAQLRAAWELDPHLAVQIGRCWNLGGHNTHRLLEELIEHDLLAVYDCPEALSIYFNSLKSLKHVSHHVLFWHQTSPIESINLLSPPYGQKRLIVQYALRSLQLHPIHICFFYVPQIVQQLRHDESGMVAEYILETAKFSQKFSHQIIWNIMANMYMDDDANIPDPMKPQLDQVLADLKDQFSPEEKEYYETEFKFFGEITGISGKLKPYIKKSKAEKKEKIDEELSKIELPDGVYLPSHPDGTVVDIDRLGGKPLQSHAKAPFLAKFKIRVDVDEVDEENVMEVQRKTEDVWQGGIFKVGDDCRQDVLALQIISVFRSIFSFCGLDVYVFPYKVTATAAGRGVIDVLPNSISRDMLGREAVNGLDQWFQSKHGGPNSIDFQRARLNFVKSMAAYSIITYLLQFKDRHNGNIMYDEDGHVIHIDFGFCFDIAPGGVTFEAVPFKLTKEMVRVMGGSQNAQPFKWFEKLCVQAFLASRVFADDICRVVIPMLESGLPCFKGHTIKRLKERFVLHKTEAEAAQYMRSLISKSYESNFTKGYDEFQRLTNGIPY